MAWTSNEPLFSNFNLLKSTGSSLVDSGKDATSTGMEVAQRGLGDIAPAANYFKTALNGDFNTLSSLAKPQTDSITKQFGNVRNMIAMQPRGGGKTSALAQLPIEQIQALANIISNTRNAAAQSLPGIGATESGIGLNLGQLGLGQQEAGLNSASAAAGIAERQKGIDIADSWGHFFKNLTKSAIGGGVSAAGMALGNMGGKPAPVYGPGN